MPQDEVLKQQKEEIAAGGEGPGGGGPYRGFDPFMQYLLHRLDTMEANLRGEISNLRQEMKQDMQALHQEVYGSNRWALGTIIAVIIGLGGVIASLLAILARLP